MGCCFGSCTHVWNYEQTTAFLYPTLARSMRRAELGPGLTESGQNIFRIRLPLGQEPWRGAAADGQMGVVMKCYREWQLSGDNAWLADNWPSIRSLLEYAWLPGCWDADQDGVMEGVQHNTYDVEFYGPNPMMSVWYLGALRAGEEMAKGAGDTAFAARCRGLYERGSQSIEAELFNGEYYIQKIQAPASLAATRPELRIGKGETNLADPDYQVGNGCLIDQLIGQYFAHVVGLGYLLDPGHIRSALGRHLPLQPARELLQPCQRDAHVRPERRAGAAAVQLAERRPAQGALPLLQRGDDRLRIPGRGAHDL